jgi:hypothetical protein
VKVYRENLMSALNHAIEARGKDERKATMAPGVLLYRCRLCGESHETRTINFVHAIGTDAFNGHLVTLHDCGPGQVGVADLLGGKADATEDGK